ncbi:MAG: hypothetical protein JRI68_28520 [Deltaproteobacteria bacterium]|nr:hypothetical protein [Deltaproteobacteria bacterium]
MTTTLDRRGRLLALLATVALLCALPGDALGFPFKAARARHRILTLDLDGAAAILTGDDDSADVAIERGRLALFRGDCDGAVATLERPDLEDDDESAALLSIALGCARGSAATVIRRDERGVVVRFQDDEDEALFPLIVEAALATRESLARDLGTRLPLPIFIDLVRDQLTLAAMSGLPERAAQTTGTVAVAKWGRVMMISPRAAGQGYPWLDTLAHELAHLVISQATAERAPLWLQEGVAKRQETRWREPTPFDGFPPPDAVAWQGIQRGLALPLTELGPSIAMLPSPEQASIAFAEVVSFMHFWVDQVGAEALPKLLEEIRDALPGSDANSAIAKVSNVPLAEWDRRWRAYLAAKAPSLPAEYTPGTVFAAGPKLARRRRLGQLLLDRRHFHAAAKQLSRAHRLLPTEASLRCLYADALRGQGHEVDAAALVTVPGDVRLPTGRWWSLHDLFQLGDALPRSRWHALGNDPLDPPIPCHELPEGEYPSDPLHRAICEAAWRMPRVNY